MSLFKEYLEEFEAEKTAGVPEEERMSWEDFKGMNQSNSLNRGSFERSFTSDEAELWFLGY